MVFAVGIKGKNEHANQRRRLRVLLAGLQNGFDHVVATNIQCWGYEVEMVPSAWSVRAEEREEQYGMEGDVLLCDLDGPWSLYMNTTAAHASYQEMLLSSATRHARTHHIAVRLTIALSSSSVSRMRLEQIGVVALLQKPFAMGYLQRYLQVLQRVLWPEPGAVSMPVRDTVAKRRKILVVDDDCDIAYAIQQCLVDEFDADVAVAYDGVTALEQCIEWQPQCVVTDLILPWMNGYQVMRCLAAGSVRTVPPFVVMSALTQLEDLRKYAFLAGKAVTYIQKPFHVEQLLTAIEQVCAG